MFFLSALLPSIGIPAATLHVRHGNPTSVPPFATWQTAASNIQDAVNSASDGDTVLVTNGLYNAGGGTGPDFEKNRVAVARPITVRSVNGPAVTLIEGLRPAQYGGVGEALMRGVYLSAGAQLIGFTVTNGAALRGGGVFGESSAVVSNCVLRGNWAGHMDGGGAWGGTLLDCVIDGNVTSRDGGGADRATLVRCRITNNSANRGGGADDSTLYSCIVAGNRAEESGGGTLQTTLYHCTVTGNSAHRNGGVASKWHEGEAAYNCIISGNHASVNPNYTEEDKGRVTLIHCCTSPLPATGQGNIDADPLLLSADQIATASPCVGAGAVEHAFGVDLNGFPWAQPPSIGASEPVPGTATGPINAELTGEFLTIAPGYRAHFKAAFSGRVTGCRWTTGDGTVFTDRLVIEHAWSTPGNYLVTVTAFNDSLPEGVSSTVLVQVVPAPAAYVDTTSASPAFPYDSWATAARTIQEAIDAGTVAGRRVWVTNGLYDTGGAAVSSLLTSRVALTNGVWVESVNGPAATVIRGAMPGGPGSIVSPVRCAFVGNGSRLRGFTLTGGSSMPGETSRDHGGGGAWCSPRGVVSGCIISNNVAAVDGGGVHGGIAEDCVIVNNVAGDDGGGADGTKLYRCVLEANHAAEMGGGADESELYGCRIARNSAITGGGVDDCFLQDCVVVENVATYWGGGMSESRTERSRFSQNEARSGGGAWSGTLHNCILEKNTAFQSGSAASYSMVKNCTIVGNLLARAAVVPSLENSILYDNEGGDYAPSDEWRSNVRFTCAEYLLPGTGNIAVPPLFVDRTTGDYRLRPLSPCINAGRNSLAPPGPDFGQLPRISGGTVDMGAHEFPNPASRIAHAWLQSFGLPMDGTADAADPDADGASNYHEWVAGTDPRSNASALTIVGIVRMEQDLIVTWRGVPGRLYRLERSPSLTNPGAFRTVAANLPGELHLNVHAHVDGALGGPWFYRLHVELE